MAKKVVTFGEVMLRLNTPGYQKFVQATGFDATYAGGEVNVAASIANFGMDAYFVTKLPPHEMGEACKSYIRKYGVKTDYIQMEGERLGSYYVETGASQRPSKVIYDRANSAIANAKPGDFDWDTILDGASLFHFTGITPALSDSCAEVTLEAVKACKKLGVKVSCDLNYRKKLWSVEKANKVMTELMEYVDILIGNEEDAEKVFGIKAGTTDVHAGNLDDAGYREVSKKLLDTFKLEKVAITLRESYSASDNGWSALLFDGKEYYKSKKYDIHIVDRVGGGDSFGGGLLYALLSDEMNNQEVIEYAVAASCLKHTIPGDFNLASKADVINLMTGDGSGRVQR